MRVLKHTWLIVTAVFFTGCASVSVQEDYDPQTDFSALKTYDWAQTDNASGLSDLDMTRVKNAVNAQLQKKGCRRQSDNPDFLVSAHVAVKSSGKVAGTNVSINSDTVSLSGRAGTGNTDTGILTLNFLDPASNALIWQGTARGALKEQKTPEKRAERINTVVSKMLGQFPPG